jgi:hypothetical protein
MGRRSPPSLKSPGGVCPARVCLTLLGVVLPPDGRAINASAVGWKTVSLTCCREPSLRCSLFRQPAHQS